MEQKIQGNLNILATGKISRLLWDYSLPAVTGMLVMSLYNVIDRIFIGQGVGTEAIAGLAITFPVMNVASALGVLVGAGASARVSINMGAGNHHGASLVLGNSLTLILIIAAVYISCFAWWPDTACIRGERCYAPLCPRLHALSPAGHVCHEHSFQFQ